MIDRANKLISFGDFVVDRERRLLMKGDEVVPLKAKAFEVLLVLIENRGEIVSKSALLDAVWENQFVEENNLTVHVTALRKALGEKRNEYRYIVTVPGKGYRFVADIESERPDLLVERRTLETVVIDEEIFEEANDESKPVLSLPGQRRKTTGLTLVLATAGVLLVGALVAYWAGFGRQLFAASVPFREHSVVQLTTNGKVGNAALSPDGKLFAYVIDDLGLKSLWVGNVEAGNHLALRPPAEARYVNIVFAPDSSHLLYSVRDDTGAGLFRIPVLGGPTTKLADDVTHFALSPDGQRIARPVRDGENTNIVVSLLDGSDARKIITFTKDQFSVYGSLSWAPDGTRIALSVEKVDSIYRQDIGIIDVASGELTRVAPGDYRQVTKTSWLKEGDGLVITAIEGTSHSSVPQHHLVHVSLPDGITYQITTDRSNYGESWHNDAGATLSLDGTTDSILAVEHRQLSNVWVGPADDLSTARQITFSSFGRYDGLWGLDWTPDGKIIYTTSDTRAQYLARMNADGTEQIQLTTPTPGSEYVDSVLRVTSDGRFIIFHSNRINSQFDVWRSDIDGGNPKRLTFGGRNFVPVPSADGKWVYYKTHSPKNAMCRVPIDGGERECTDKDATWYSFSPDGELMAASYVTDRNRLAIFSTRTHEVFKHFELPKTGTLYMGSQWTPDGTAITFRDTTYGYWKQPIDGGPAVRIVGLPRERLYNFAWSRDGKSLAFVRGQEIRDVVIFRREN